MEKKNEHQEADRICVLNGQLVSVACHCECSIDALLGKKNLVDAEVQIFRERDEIEGVQCLCKGSVVLLKQDKDGQVHAVGVALPGDLLGYPDILVGNSHLNTAVALEESHFYFLHREQFIELTRKDSLIPLRLMAKLSQRITDVEERLTNRSVDPNLNGADPLNREE